MAFGHHGVLGMHELCFYWWKTSATDQSKVHKTWLFYQLRASKKPNIKRNVFSKTVINPLMEQYKTSEGIIWHVRHFFEQLFNRWHCRCLWPGHLRNMFIYSSDQRNWLEHLNMRLKGPSVPITCKISGKIFQASMKMHLRVFVTRYFFRSFSRVRRIVNSK